MQEITELIQIAAPIAAIAGSWAALNARLKSVENSQKRTEERIEKIETNHLTHVQQDTDHIKACLSNLKQEIAIIKVKIK